MQPAVRGQLTDREFGAVFADRISTVKKTADLIIDQLAAEFISNQLHDEEEVLVASED